jgi:hypothetical protein
MRCELLLGTLVVLPLFGASARGQVDTPAVVKAAIARSKANVGRDARILTLQGVKEVTVATEPLGAPAASIGLDTAHIRTLVEGRLRDHGLPVTAPLVLGHVDPATGKLTDFHMPKGGQFISPPIVDVQVTVATLPTGPTAVAVNLWVEQSVSLSSDPSIMSLAHTWTTGTLFVGIDAQAAQQAVDGLITGQVDKLLSAAQSANR